MSKRKIPERLQTTPSPLVNQVVDFFNHSTEYHVQQFSVMASLILCGHLVSRKYVSPTYLQTHLYGIMFGTTGIGKNYILKGLDQFNLLWVNKVSDMTSSAALRSAFIANPSVLMANDEIGDNLNHSNPLNRDLMTGIKTVYNVDIWSDKSYALRDKVKMQNNERFDIQWPALSLIGASTPGQLEDSMSPSEVESGVINRMILVNAFEHEQIEKDEMFYKPSNDLLNSLASISTLPKNPYDLYKDEPELEMIKYDRGVNDLLRSYRKKYMKHKNKVYFVRVLENSIRIALILAVFSGALITIDLIQWAIDYTEYWAYNTKKLSEKAGSNANAKNRERLLDKIKNAGDEGIKPHKINSYMSGGHYGLEPYKRDALIKDLINDRIIEKKGIMNIKTGKDIYYYFYIEGKKK